VLELRAMNIRQKRGKYYKKFKPFGAGDLVVIVLLVITWLYILFEVIRG
jgi:hypothetical protein